MCHLTFGFCALCRGQTASAVPCSDWDPYMYSAVDDKNWIKQHNKNNTEAFYNVVIFSLCEDCRLLLVDVLGQVGGSVLHQLHIRDMAEIVNEVLSELPYKTNVVDNITHGSGNVQ